MVPHRMTSWNGWNTVLCWGLTENDVSPLFTPLYHAGGLGAFLVPILAVGGTIVLHAGFDPAEVWATVARERCTVVLGVPTIWKLLLEHPSFETADLSSIRWLISGGAPLPLYLIDAYQKRGVVFKQGYGLTEVGVNCFAMSVEESVAKKGSIGRPLMMTEARLVDEAGAEVPVGEVGELCLRGPHVSKGLLAEPLATAAALDDDGFFHTGDLARKDADGFFTIAGRRKDMLISGGVNVYPAEIEGELLLHPAVQDAAVVGVPDPTWGEVGVAFVVPPAGREPLEGGAPRLRRGAPRALQAPREVVFVDVLPRTAYGKVVKGELRDGSSPAEEAGERAGRPSRTGSTGAATRCSSLNGGMMSFAAWEPWPRRWRSGTGSSACDFRGQLLSPGEVPATSPATRTISPRCSTTSGWESRHLVGTSFGGWSRSPRGPRPGPGALALGGHGDGPRLPAIVPRGRRSARPAAGRPRRRPRGGLRPLVELVYSRPGRRTARPRSLARGGALVARLPHAWFSGLDRLLGAIEGST